MVARRHAQDARLRARLGHQPRRQQRAQLEPLGAAVGAQVVGDHGPVALEQALGRHRGAHAHARVAGQGEPRDRRDREGRAERGERRLAEDDGRQRARHAEDDPASEGR